MRKLMDLKNYGIYPSKKLPYDAEIEYLESDGNQWIDTGVIPDANTGLQLFSSSPVNTNDAYIAGERNDTSSTRWVIGWTSAPSKWYCGYGEVIRSEVDGSPILTSVNYLGDRLFKVGDSYFNTLPSLSFFPSYNIRLFGSAGVVADYTSAAVKIYSAKISVGNILVRDFIPVRVGQVGAMYDKRGVGGINSDGTLRTDGLYFNQGTGNFILGPDKKNVSLPYDSEVEYLESTGTQWIDTGIRVDSSYGFKCSFMGVSEIDGVILGVKGGADSRWCLSGLLSQNINLSWNTVAPYTGQGLRVIQEARMNYLNDWKRVVNGVHVDSVVPPLDASANSFNVCMFAGFWGSTTVSVFSTVRVYSVQISKEQEIIRDFIPVRIGRIGAMYDRANPFGGPNGNGLYFSETDPLIPGPDKS